MPPSNANPSHQLAKSAAENWSGWSDAQLRRRAQNRLNQRARRQRRISEKWQPEIPSRVRRILPKPNDGTDDVGEGIDSQVIVTRRDESHMIMPSIDVLSNASPALQSSYARKMFHYACTIFWPTLYATTTTIALCQSSIMEPLFLDTVIWAMATIQKGGVLDTECTKTICESQLRASQTLRKSLAAGIYSDAVLSCIASLAIRIAEPEEADGLLLESGSILGHYSSLGIECLGGLHVTGHMMYEPKHYDVFCRLLAARGGMETVMLPGIAERLTLADLYNSCRQLSRPSFAMCLTFQSFLRDEMAGNRPPAQEVEAFPVGEDFTEVLLDLRQLCRLLDQYCDGVEAGANPDIRDFVSRRDIVQHRVLALPRSGNGPGEICRLATLVFTLGVTYPLPRRRPLRLAATMLSQVLRDPRHTRDQEPAFLFWAVMIGGLATGIREDTLAAFYRDRLGELSDELGLRSWQAAKLILQRFIWLDRACDGGGHALWDRSRRGRSDADILGESVIDTYS